MNYVLESISKKSFGLLLVLVFSGCATEERLDVSCNEYFSDMASSDFIDLGNGLVRDRATQLYWYRCPLGQTFVSGKCTGKVLDADFETAQGTVRNFRLSAVSSPNATGEWRLPTESEYEKLTSVPCHSPGIDVTTFPNIDTETFRVPFSASISSISQLNLPSQLTPCKYKDISLSDKLNQNSSLEILNKIGSFKTPPYALHRITYLALIGEILVASLVIT